MLIENCAGLDSIAGNDDVWRMGYPGGKGRLWQSIVGLMPPHDVYIETHLGGGAILRNKQPASQSVGIDLDERVIAAARHWDIPNLTLHHGDAAEFLMHQRFGPETLIYLDPPYVASTKNNRRYYRHEYSDDDHLCLLSLVNSLQCRVMISGYPSRMYEEALRGWHRRDLINVSHSGRRTERIWANFEFTADLHDYRPVGADFRERERVKRKTGRWRDRLASLPEVERRAILAALIAAPDVEPEFVSRLLKRKEECAA
jgi:DNA adenine methylase